MSYSVGTSGSFIALHVTILIFDAARINISPNYRVGYGSFTMDSIGGEYILPNGLQNNVFMGMWDFIGTSTSQYFSYDIFYSLLTNGSYGIKSMPSLPPGSPVTTYRFGYFYLQEAGCEYNYYH